MDQRIIGMKSTTFSERRVNRRQVADIQEAVALLPNDSRNELAKMICGHLGWTTAKDRSRYKGDFWAKVYRRNYARPRMTPDLVHSVALANGCFPHIPQSFTSIGAFPWIRHPLEECGKAGLGTPTLRFGVNMRPGWNPGGRDFDWLDIEAAIPS